ncbi:MAG: hypothetical protein HQK54_11365 [Oligoflexales bacterium]|nr:hypothetical protein [Oligoflexales bacterium]
MIKVSRTPDRNGAEEWGTYNDFLDFSIIDNIEILNNNADFVTTNSCSGHGGCPYVCMIFKNAEIRNKYLKISNEFGVFAQKSDAYRMSFFDSDDPEMKIYEEWGFGFRKDEVTAWSAKLFWKRIMLIFR